MSKQQDFIELIAPLIADNVKGRYSISAIISQACLESRYGESKLSRNYYNYFGLKCGSSWRGKSVNMNTKEEYTTGTLTNIRGNFRVYPNMKKGVKGYFDFINAKRYKKLVGITSPVSYLNTIIQCGYCTSSSYVNSCKSIIVTYSLINYDIAYSVLKGVYGNGEERKKSITERGYNYDEVQRIVNLYVERGVKV